MDKREFGVAARRVVIRRSIPAAAPGGEEEGREDENVNSGIHGASGLDCTDIEEYKKFLAGSFETFIKQKFADLKYEHPCIQFGYSLSY
jgi:hypothetical protein